MNRFVVDFFNTLHQEQTQVDAQVAAAFADQRYNLWYCEQCSVLVGQADADSTRTTEPMCMLRCVTMLEAQQYARQYNHFRARWRFEPCTPTSYQPQELDELATLWCTLPGAARRELRQELLLCSDALQKIEGAL